MKTKKHVLASGQPMIVPAFSTPRSGATRTASGLLYEAGNPAETGVANVFAGSTCHRGRGFRWNLECYRGFTDRTLGYLWPAAGRRHIWELSS